MHLHLESAREQRACNAAAARHLRRGEELALKLVHHGVVALALLKPGDGRHKVARRREAVGA